MLLYNLKKTTEKPLYEALYDALKEDILEGRLKAGQRMPSKRELASSNDLSVTTVLNAYQQLLMEGYLVSKERSGYYVADVQAMPGSHELTENETSFYTEHKWFADFRSNNALYHHFPEATWKKVIREILSDYDMELIKRGNPFGIPELRDQIAAYLERARGILVSPTCIVIGAGIEYLYARLITLFPASAIYAAESPGYRKIPNIFEAYHLRWKSVDMDESGISMPDLWTKDVTIAHVSPEHHYPLGTIMSMTRRQELLNWADSAPDRYVIEDDYDCEFRYGAMPIPSLKSLDRLGKVVYMNTFSKTLSPAVRISYMVLPPSLMEAYIRQTHFFTNSTSSLEQYALARFIEKGHFERHLNRTRKLYRAEGETLLRALRDNKSIPVQQITGGSSGTHLLVKLDTRIPDETVKARAASKGVNVRFLSDFCVKQDPRYDHMLILNFSDLEADIQKEAIRRLGTIFAG